MADIRVVRLEAIKIELILKDLSELDLDSEYDLYDSLLYKTFVEGEFDDVFLSDNIKKLDKDRRQEVIGLARKYNSLCFYNGDFNSWMDSIEGVTGSDYDLISIKLLDDFDYLMRLAKNGGEDVLKFLNKFQTVDQFRNGAVIDMLRSRKSMDDKKDLYDDILETVLIEMSKVDGIYKDFTDTQKIIMCDNLDGIIYRKQDNGEYDIVPVDELKKSILEEFGEDDYSINGIDSETFKFIIENIYSSYQSSALKR